MRPLGMETVMTASAGKAARTISRLETDRPAWSGVIAYDVAKVAGETGRFGPATSMPPKKLRPNEGPKIMSGKRSSVPMGPLGMG